MKLRKLLADISEQDGVEGLPRLVDYLRMNQKFNQANLVESYYEDLRWTHDAHTIIQVKNDLIQRLFPNLKLSNVCSQLRHIKRHREITSLIGLAIILLYGIMILLGMVLSLLVYQFMFRW